MRIPFVVSDQELPSDFLMIKADVAGEPALSPFTNVNVGLYEMKPPTPLFVIVHFRLIYLVWLIPEATAGLAVVVEPSRYPEPDVVPAKVMEAGV